MRVIDPEHLVALAFQAGGHKRRERALDRNRSTPVSPDLIASKEAWHRHQASLPIREKVRILLLLQRQDLPLLAKQRPLRAWEKPWPVEP